MIVGEVGVPGFTTILVEAVPASPEELSARRLTTYATLFVRPVIVTGLVASAGLSAVQVAPSLNEYS